MIAEDTLTLLLEQSAATDEFRAALAAWRHRRPQDRIEVLGYAPDIKVERFLTKLFEALPEQVIDSVVVDGRSGCSNFTGEATLEPGGVRVRFDWDCAWKAKVEGLTAYGFPDQQRAAMEFGYDCFRVFEVVG